MRRAQQIYPREGPDGDGSGGNREPEGVSGLLGRGMIPLPVLDDVMGFDAEKTLRARRQAYQTAVRSVRWECVYGTFFGANLTVSEGIGASVVYPYPPV